MSLLRKMKRLFKFAVVVATEDSGPYPLIFNSYMGKPRSKAVNISPFGIWSRPPLNSLSFVMNGNGAESNQACISNDYAGRPKKDLEEGETVIGNKSSYFFFDREGNVVLQLADGADFIINPGSSGRVIINSDLQVNGDMDVSQTLSANELTDGSVPYTTHKHSDPQGGITGTPQN